MALFPDPVTRASLLAGALALAMLVSTAAGAQPRPALTLCDDDADCLQAYDQIDRDYPRARKGDYQAMRNVAFCLWDGCDGAVKVDRAGSCAWRRAIMRRHARRVDRSDEGHLATCHRHGY